MPPRRHIVLIAPLVLLCWLIIWLGSDLPINPIFAQNDSNPIDANAAAVAGPNDLEITLIAVNDGPKTVGEQVTFTATITSGSADGLSFFWNFGDGQTDTGQVVQHRYSQTGIYSAYVIATDGVYTERASTQVVIKQIIEPTECPVTGLDATSDSPTIAGNPTNFLATITCGNEVTFDWEFGDGSPRSSGISVSHIYQNPGDYLVTVWANNPYGQAKKQFWVWIYEAPPRGLQITYAPQQITVNQGVVFTATVESGTNVVFDWAISDGTTVSNQAVIAHSFKEIGAYEVRVTASNSADEINTTITVIVQDEPPVILRVTQDSPKPVGQPVSFDLYVFSNSRVRSEWYWGDGKIDVISSDDSQDSSSVKVIEATHAYAAAGRYLVTIAVFNSGGSEVAYQRVYIDRQPPQNNLVTITVTPTIPLVGETIIYSAILSASDVTCTWELGEGTQLPGTTVAFAYSMSKRYIIYVKCTSRDGQSYEGEIEVFVRGNFFMPLIAKNGAFAPSPSSGGSGGPGEAATPTLTPTSTATPTPTMTNTPTPPEIPTPVDTPTPTPTEIPAPVPTETPTETPTEVFTATPTETQVPVPTETSTEIPTETVTPIPTETPVPIETATETPTETPTPTATTEPWGTIPQP